MVRNDAHEGEKLDKLLRCVDDLNQRLDAYEEEEARRDRRRKDDDEYDGEPVPTNKYGSWGYDDDDRRRDSRRRRDDDDRRRSDSVSIRIAAPMSERDYRAAIDCQTRMDGAYQAVGKPGAPRPMDSESLTMYRQRLVRGLQPYSPAWGDCPAHEMRDCLLDRVEGIVRADALEWARNPQNAQADGEMREVTSRMRGGAEMTEFFGRPSSWMRAFQGNARMVSQIRTKSGVEDSSGPSWSRPLGTALA
jgi:hypothetical protein